MKNIQCTQFNAEGKCLHQAAPRRFFGAAECILFEKSKDPRVIVQCALQVKPAMPNPPRFERPVIPQPEGEFIR